MKRKLSGFLFLLCLFFSVFSGTCSAEKDYSPYVIEVKVNAGDTVSNLCDSRRIDYYAVKDALLIVNGFASEAGLSAVSPGQTLYLPRSKADADSILALYNSTVSTTIPASYVQKVTVQKGDTLTSICKEHNLTYSVCQEAIKKLNLWSSDSRLSSIYAGQELLLPTSDAAAVAITETVATAAASSGSEMPVKDSFEYYLVSHTMASGETMESVCGQLGILYSADVSNMLKAINNLSDPNGAAAGKTCLFPSKTSSNAAYTVYSHKVVFGDTIERLCEAHHVRYAEVRSLLQGLNPGSSLIALRVGEEVLLAEPAPVVSTSVLVTPTPVPASVSVPVVSSPAPASAPVSSYPGSVAPSSPSYSATSNPASSEAIPEITITVK